MREHRLYQADWLYRFYGFKILELLPQEGDGRLDLSLDPKLAWALRNRSRFPVDLNRGSRELLRRLPGLGVKSVERILKIRRHRRIRMEETGRLGVSLTRVAPFLLGAGVEGAASARTLFDRLDLRTLVAPAQLALL